MRLLFISNLFPDKAHPVRGLDNATLLQSLKTNFGFDIRAISPRPTFPPSFKSNRLSDLTPRTSDAEFDPVYPCVNYIPRIGSRWNDLLMKQSLESVFSQTLQTFRPDAILASWLFPDGCAVSKLCANNDLPLTLITQGSDTHQYLQNPIRRKKIVSAIERCQNVICRSGDLGKQLSQAGVPDEKLRVIYNGIDPETFHPHDPAQARRELKVSVDHPILLFVGNLLPVKDPIFLLKAHQRLNETREANGLMRAQLKMIGEGPLRDDILKAAADLGTSEEIELLGRQPPEQVALWMGASNALCLSSINEGFPNVILEAMACSLPIVSTDVGGIREKINSPEIGRLTPSGDLQTYVQSLEETLNQTERPLSQEDLSWESATRQYAAALSLNYKQPA